MVFGMKYKIDYIVLVDLLNEICDDYDTVYFNTEDGTLRIGENGIIWLDKVEDKREEKTG